MYNTWPGSGVTRTHCIYTSYSRRVYQWSKNWLNFVSYSIIFFFKALDPAHIYILYYIVLYNVGSSLQFLVRRVVNIIIYKI